MNILTALLDRVLLVASIGVAGATPSFIQQYRQQVSGRLDQATADLQPFAQIAQQRHDGDLNALIGHHLQSNDATFVREGQAISDMMQTVQNLSGANQALDGSLWSQAAYLIRHGDPNVANATWGLFEPAFALSGQGLVFALTVGVALWFFVVACAKVGGAVWRALTGSTRSVAR
ncbi:MAG: DUF2937 family protein [Gammaproteobacteria bacterium]